MSIRRRLVAEGIGSLFLAAAVIGSGVMAERLAGGNVAIALLANTGATVAALATLIALLGPVSGAHFNPAVSLVQALRGALPWPEAGGYALVQVLGCCLGAVLAHAMFGLSLLQTSTHLRAGVGQLLAEGVATFGLLLVILGHRRPQDAPWMVAAWIGAAYWFTASTSFANPAITIARSLTDTFAGIRPADVGAFIAAQLIGALLALWVARPLFTLVSVRATKAVQDGGQHETSGPVRQLAGALSSRARPNASTKEDAIKPDIHPDEVEERGRVSAIPSALDDEPCA